MVERFRALPRLAQIGALLGVVAMCGCCAVVGLALVWPGGEGTPTRAAGRVATLRPTFTAVGAGEVGEPSPTQTAVPVTDPVAPTLTGDSEPTATPVPTDMPLPTDTPTPQSRVLYFCGIDRCRDSGEYGQLVFPTGINVWNNPDPDRGGVKRKANHHEQATVIQERRVGELPGGLWFELTDGGWTNDLWLTEVPCTEENLDEFSLLCWGGTFPTVTPAPDTAALPVTIHGVTDYKDSIGALHLVGEIRNQSDQNLHFVEVIATFYDASNQVTGGLAYFLTVPSNQGLQGLIVSMGFFMLIGVIVAHFARIRTWKAGLLFSVLGGVVWYLIILNTGLTGLAAIEAMDVVRLFTYAGFMITGAVIFSIFWTMTSGMEGTGN